jgi:NADH dehydrogenase FAD-containing subunit
VIVGGGFAGIAAAKALRHCDTDVTVIDRRNHHIFQPLLYQVATAVLAPSEVPDQGIGFLKKSAQVPSANAAAMRCRGDAKEVDNG